MSLETDNCDVDNTSLRTMYGGNGDYYIEVWDKVDGLNVCKSVRIAMSGGNATPEIRLAVAKLHKAMDEANKNEYPK